jgi:YbbR domain-containing protein
MKQPWEKIISLAGSNFGLKVLSLVIAVGLWLAGHRDIERAVEVPVKFRNIPSDLMVTDTRVDYVVLRLVGPRTLVSTLKSDDLRLSIDLNGAKPGLSSYPLGLNSFSIPRGVTVGRVTPPVIQLRLEPVLKRVLPVSVRYANALPSGYKIAETVIEPPMVSVQGPADEVRRLTGVATVPIDVDESKPVIKRDVRLSADGKFFSFSTDQVTVSIKIEEEEITREFRRVEVRGKEFTGEYSVEPRSVYLRLAGPTRVLGGFELGADQVYLDLNGLEKGEHMLPLVFSFPAEIKIIEQKPRQFKVRITKPAT